MLWLCYAMLCRGFFYAMMWLCYPMLWLLLCYDMQCYPAPPFSPPTFSPSPCFPPPPFTKIKFVHGLIKFTSYCRSSLLFYDGSQDKGTKCYTLYWICSPFSFGANNKIIYFIVKHLIRFSVYSLSK